MFGRQSTNGTKIMLDLHTRSVKEVKQLLEEHFAKIEQYNTSELYLITGRGNHVNSDGSRGVLKKILPKLLKPYCQSIMQINQETGAYKIIFKPRQELSELKSLLSKFLVDEEEQIHYAHTLKQKVEKNDIEAMLALALIYLHQAIKGFDDIHKGTTLLLKAKHLGSLEADVQLGILYHEGIILNQDHKKAFEYFCYAAGKEHAVAQYYVAVCYLHGKGVKYNDEQAVKWMKKSADQNDADAQHNLGDFYLLGKITKQDKELGIYYKTKAAEQGLAGAQIDLARCYATGYGVKQDYKTAFKWYLSAAQSNEAYAVYQVGSYLFDGRDGLPPNPVEAFRWFLKAAELGDAEGQAQVARQYLFGEGGVKQDIAKGVQWATKAVAQKNRYAYYVMAKAHLEGLGVEQDGSKAYSLMKRSAKAGYSEAQYELGLVLIGKVSSDIPPDYKAGVRWLKKAAAQNHVEAEQILRDLYAATATPEETRSVSEEKEKDKELKFSTRKSYELGQLAYHLVVVSWYMTSEESQNYLRKEHLLLYNEFIQRVNHLGIESPPRKFKEKPTNFILNYVMLILKRMGERSILAVYFNIGFKMMAVNMIEFTYAHDKADIVQKLLDYLRHVKDYLRPIGINITCINKIETALNKQVTHPTKQFSSIVEQLERELKNQLFSTDYVAKLSPNNVNRYSMWYKGAVAIGLTAMVLGVAVAKQEEIEEGIKTICHIQ